MDNNKRIITNTVSLYGRMFITMIISFFTSRLTLQLLGVEDYGLYNLVGGVVMMFNFLNASMGTAVQRFYSIKIGENDPIGLKKVFGAGLFIHIIISIITLFFLEIFAIFFLHRLNIPQERLYAAQIVFQISSASMILNILNVPYAALLRAREAFSKMAILDIVQSFLRLGILLLLARTTYDKLISFSGMSLVITFLYVFAIFLLCRPYEESKLYLCREKNIIKEMFSFTLLMLIGVMSNLLRTNGIPVLVNLFFGLAINAAFAVAGQVTSIIESFTSNFKQSVVPQLMSSFSQDRSRSYKLAFSSTKFTFILFLFVAIPCIFETDYLLLFWLKTPPEHSSLLVKLSVINSIIYTFPYFVTQSIHASGKIKRLQVFTVVLNIITVFIIWITLKLGASFTSVMVVSILFSVSYNIINLYYAKKEFDFNVGKFVLDVVLKCLGVFVIVGICIWLFKGLFDEGLVRLILTSLLGILLSIIVGYTICLNGDERFFIRGICVKMVQKFNKNER